MKPLVSVVIPTYNCERYLPETLASVFAQTLQDIEVIVVDDGSSDGTALLFEQPHKCVTYIPVRHTGIPAKARNVGLEYVRGEYVAFLDSDDLWEPDKLERQVKLMKARPEVGMCFADHVTFGDTVALSSAFDQAKRSMAVLSKTKVSEDTFVITSESLLQDCLLRGPIPLWTSTILVRRSSLETVGRFNEEGLDEDTQMWLRFAKMYKAGYINKVLARRRIRPTSITAIWCQTESGVESLRTLETLEQWLLLNNKDRLAIRARRSEIASGLGYYEYSRHNRIAARKWFCHSLKERFSFKAVLYLLASMLSTKTLAWLRDLRETVRV
jgi:glycosyltransferase involved in cell wall biosynthesis